MDDAPRRMRLRGLHHITAICADLTATTAFYRDLLGLALVREAVNDDDPDARHFWFGEDGGEGGMVSFMEYPQLEAGRAGAGAPHHFAFRIGSREELDAWKDYLRSRDVQTTEVLQRGGLRSLYLRDPDGHLVELATAA